MGAEVADFSGYATKAGLKCSDGRTITAEAFKHMDKMQVPLVWQHGHKTPENVLGHVLLEARNDGVYAYGFFNDTKQGLNAKALVKHKDINRLSIYANQLVEKSSKVLHGIIHEVSLVIAGANPGAIIDFISVQHADGMVVDLEDEAIIHTGLEIEFGVNPPVTDDIKDHKSNPTSVAHGDQALTAQQVYDGLSQVEKDLVHFMIGQALEIYSADQNQNMGHSDDNTTNSNVDDNVSNGNTNTTTDVNVDDNSGESETMKDNEGNLTHQEGNTVTNVFEQQTGTSATGEKYALSHADMKGIVADALKLGSLRDAVEAYAVKHGIDNIDVLFPDAKNITNTPDFNTRRIEWVAGVLNGTRHTPFSRIKTITADLTQEEARARGYIKGTMKVEEWFGVSRRTTSPTTIYKKQKLDRDDIVDITDFDVVAWLKGEMRIMLEEEVARAIMISDGRDVSDTDKIKDPIGASDGAGLRSILNDHELYVTTINVNVDDASSSYDEVVDAVMDGMEFYKGTGTPDFYTTIGTLNKFLKAKDTLGRRLYATKADVAAALGVNQIITVEPMNNVADLIGIIVNLVDYNIGADKGGEVSMFDDFDIDYNQQKYLIETRLSGALTKFKSALVIKKQAATNVLLAVPTVPTFNATTGVVTIPTMTHVVYKDGDGSTLSAGAQTALSAGDSLNVTANAASGYYFANSAEKSWTFFKRS